jgi:BirA family biotin operon repressor/biotin-[acetyl-CoA-carboxylase] ligase
MMPRVIDVIRLLADGALHSGNELAAVLDCSRTAVWKNLKGLRDIGLDVAAHAGRGYQLGTPIELLDADRIRSRLGAAALARLESLELEPVLDSTSDALRRRPAPGPGHLHVMLAEFQRGGRGRRGRAWVSPFGSGLCLSVSWLMDTARGGLAGLSLALGVAAQGALAKQGAAGVGLKWPNDLVVGNGKLAGLLLDLDGEADGPMKIVAGIGVNVRPDPGLKAGLQMAGALQPVALDECCAGLVSRNVLAGELIDAFGEALATFEQHGFEPFADAWRALDVLYGRRVSVQVGKRTWHGLASGIAPDGALLVARNGELEAVMSGDVTVRQAL